MEMIQTTTWNGYGRTKLGLKFEENRAKPREEGTELCKDRCREKTSEHLVRVAFDQRTETQKNNATIGNSQVEEEAGLG